MRNSTVAFQVVSGHAQARGYGLSVNKKSDTQSRATNSVGNKVIALDLHLSERTVEIHRSRVMEKIKVRSVAQLVKLSLLLPKLVK
jgi:FixJ family two-component response regulator